MRDADRTTGRPFMKPHASSPLFRALPALVTLLFLGSAKSSFGGETAKPVIEEKPANGPTIYDQIWGLPVLYKDKSNPYIQEISLLGRIHGNWADVESNRGDWTDWEARRVRAGLRVKFLQEFEAKAEARFLPFSDPIYAGLTEATLSWSPSPAFKLSLGKQLPRFTMEGSISSNDLVTFERSNVANTFWVGEDNVSTGVSISGETGPWRYFAGVFSGEFNKGFGKFNQGYYGVASVGYDFKHQVHMDRALLQFDYVYNNGDPQNNGPKSFENITTLGWDLKQGRFGLTGNVIYGSQLGKQPDAWGFVIIPTYAITKKLEAVMRYTIVSSEHNRGVKPERRYENEVTGIAGSSGDRYQAVYAGLNYYIYGNKLKLQTGIEYGTMRDRSNKGGAFDSWSFVNGIRLSF